MKMIFRELRLKEWVLKDDETVTKVTVLRFCVHVYRESQLMRVRYPINDDKHADTYELEFIFSLARKIGIFSLQIFADNWQQFVTCEQLQQLILMVAPTDHDGGVTSRLAPELIKIIQAFYKSRLFHGEDSCLLLTKYLKPRSVLYRTVVTSIMENAEHYHSEALFHLAQLQAANRRSLKEVMNADIFAIVTKAFDKISGASPSAKMLEYIDWLFRMCTSNPFYAKMISLVCGPGTDQEIVLRVLQRMESQKSLIKHSLVAELGVALVHRYREHFTKRFSECGHAAYSSVIAEMQRARLECRHFVDNGEAMFDSEVVELVRSSHSSKRKLMKMLSVDFPERPKPASS